MAGRSHVPAPNATVAAREPLLGTNVGVRVTADAPSLTTVIVFVAEKFDPSSANPKLRFALWNAASPIAGLAGTWSPRATTCPPTARAGVTRPLPARGVR